MMKRVWRYDSDHPSCFVIQEKDGYGNWIGVAWASTEEVAQDLCNTLNGPGSAPSAQADASERMAEALEEIKAMSIKMQYVEGVPNIAKTVSAIEEKAVAALQAYKETKK